MATTDMTARAGRQRAGRALAAFGTAGSAASLLVVYEAVRGVAASGGFCAHGGAYAVAHQCSRADTVLLLCGVLGILTFGGLVAAATAWLRGPVVGVTLVLWVTLFGMLGWNLVDLGANPPHAMGADARLIVLGAVCGLAALSGLAPLVRLSFSRAPTGGAPGGGQLAP